MNMLRNVEKQQLREELYFARIKHKVIAVRAGVTASAVSQFFHGEIASSPAIEKAAFELLRDHYKTSRYGGSPVKVNSYFFPGLTVKEGMATYNPATGT